MPALKRSPAFWKAKPLSAPKACDQQIRIMSGTLYLLPNAVASGDPAQAVPAALPAAALARARTIDRFFVEAAKTARAAIKAMGHPKPVAELSIIEIGHDPDPAKIDEWLAPVAAGEDAAILSESGCPGIADPGAQIAARAHALGIRVSPLIGPSSLILSLMASGLDGQRFRFLGYLPIHEAERREAIRAAEAQSRASETQIFIETPYRNAQMLAALIEALSPSTRLCVATDVTGPNESIRTQTAADWRRASDAERALPKLPTVFLLLAESDRSLRYASVNAVRKGERKAETHRPAKSDHSRRGKSGSGRGRRP